MGFNTRSRPGGGVLSARVINLLCISSDISSFVFDRPFGFRELRCGWGRDFPTCELLSGSGERASLYWRTEGSSRWSQRPGSFYFVRSSSCHCQSLKTGVLTITKKFAPIGGRIFLFSFLEQSCVATATHISTGSNRPSRRKSDRKPGLLGPTVPNLPVIAQNGLPRSPPVGRDVRAESDRYFHCP